MHLFYQYEWIVCNIIFICLLLGQMIDQKSFYQSSKLLPLMFIEIFLILISFKLQSLGKLIVSQTLSLIFAQFFILEEILQNLENINFTLPLVLILIGKIIISMESAIINLKLRYLYFTLYISLRIFTAFIANQSIVLLKTLIISITINLLLQFKYKKEVSMELDQQKSQMKELVLCAEPTVSIPRINSEDFQTFNDVIQNQSEGKSNKEILKIQLVSEQEEDDDFQENTLKRLESQDSSLNADFYQNLMRFIPQGCMVLNKGLEIIYINDKCEKLFEWQEKEKILFQIKQEVQKQYLDHVSSKDGSKSISSNFSKTIVNNNEFSQQSVGEPFLDALRMSERFQSRRSLKKTTKLSKSSKGSSQTTNEQPILTMIYKYEYNKKEICLKIRIFKVSRQSFSVHDFDEKSEKVTNTVPFLIITITNYIHKQKFSRIKQEVNFQSRLLQSFSHELRTPINCSIQVLNVALDQIPGKNKLTELISSAISSITLLMYQLNNILDNAAITCGELELQNKGFFVFDLIQNIQTIYCQAYQKKNIQFSYYIDDFWGKNLFYSDQDRIIQILVNLLDNSIKFTDVNGQIKIKFLEKRNFNNVYMQIIVKDSGQGMEPEKLEKLKNILENQKDIFGQHDSQTDQENYLGLGLSISNKIARKLSQSQKGLEIRSKVNESMSVSFMIMNNQTSSDEDILFNFKSLRKVTTRFISINDLQNSSKNSIEYVEQDEVLDQHYKSSHDCNDNLDLQYLKIPSSQIFCFQKLHKQKMERSQISIRISPQDKLKQEILIVDDIPFNHIALASMLVQCYRQQPDEAYNGLEAIQKVKERAMKDNQYRLIFMDIEMPGLNGFETTQKILQICEQKQQQVKIIMCSAYDSQANINQAKQSGMVDILTKPVKKHQLLQIMKDHLQCHF